METIKFKASCPTCGRNLFDGSPRSCVEGYCPKCKNFYRICFHDTGYTVSAQLPDDRHSRTTAK